MASLGFEKSYRETVVLMARSYLSKLSSIGSAESKTLAPESTTERVEVCTLVEACIPLVTYNFLEMIAHLFDQIVDASCWISSDC